MSARLKWVGLGGDFKAAVLPPSVARETFLLAANVRTSCVQLIVASGLEQIKMLLVLVL